MIGEIDTLVEDPSTLTWWEAYGLKVMAIGEDGDWAALGHHAPRRMVAAMLKAAREQLSLDRDEVFNIGYHQDPGEVAAVLEQVRHTNGVFTIPEGCDLSWEWVVRYDVADTDPERLFAVPVTLWIP